MIVRKILFSFLIAIVGGYQLWKSINHYIHPANIELLYHPNTKQQHDIYGAFAQYYSLLNIIISALSLTSIVFAWKNNAFLVCICISETLLWMISLFYLKDNNFSQLMTTPKDSFIMMILSLIASLIAISVAVSSHRPIKRHLKHQHLKHRKTVRSHSQSTSEIRFEEDQQENTQIQDKEFSKKNRTRSKDQLHTSKDKKTKII
ncbi:uncharacterized protein MONOS_16934 [Monocercomonoides exilis]|uniref:uncharacterized protein n=1 Tax=Monocercomonoides exilis TaxID=2049356 RepID=UPI00355A5950|nr:hypothetical protein MONOS_16934 [Monocercomonoides exilis]